MVLSWLLYWSNVQNINSRWSSTQFDFLASLSNIKECHVAFFGYTKGLIICGTEETLIYFHLKLILWRLLAGYRRCHWWSLKQKQLTTERKSSRFHIFMASTFCKTPSSVLDALMLLKMLHYVDRIFTFMVRFCNEQCWWVLHTIIEWKSF